MTNDEIWQAIKTKAKERTEYIENLDAVYGVKLTKEEEASYRIAVKDGKMEIQSKEADDADCTIILSVKNLKRLLLGNLKTTTAFMTGKLKVKGNVGRALKLEQTVKQVSFRNEKTVE